MTIFAATDFSAPATEAVAVAADIAKKRGEVLVLWHAVQPQMSDPVDPYVEPIRAKCATRLEEEAERLRGNGLTVQTSVVIGYPDHQLPSSLPPDTTLIVTGAQGQRHGAHWLIGSVAERIARIATVPMLVVRNAERLRQWIGGSCKLEVIVATDFSAVSDFALRNAAHLRDLGACNLELLYVEYPPSDYARLGVAGPICVHHPHPLVDEVLSRELERRAEAVTLGGDVTTRIAKTLGQAGDLIASEGESVHADLIVTGAHQRRAASRMWHGSIVQGVLHSAQTNVLLIPFHTADEDIRALAPVSPSTIVAATDFSPAGNRAVAWACSMARANGRVVIVNVVADDEQSEESSRALERVKATVGRHDGLRVETQLVSGSDVAATICAAAERIAADLVIVGSHTRSRVSHLFGGSVSDALLARSHRPVLVVPDPGAM